MLARSGAETDGLRRTWARALRLGEPAAKAGTNCRFLCNPKRISRLYRLERRWRLRTSAMAKIFKIGDHVSWNSEAGRVRGRIVRVYRKDVSYRGYVHHASAEDPQYAIRSDETDHIALHKGRALRRLLH